MSHQPKSRPVSWDDESLTICSPNAESPSNQDYDDTLSDVCFFDAEAGVESMTPFEFGCYSRRLWHIEKINVLLRDICFGEGIVDQLPEDKITCMDKVSSLCIRHSFSTVRLSNGSRANQTRRSDGV